MRGFNLADWSLAHRPLIYFLIFLLGVLGCFSYIKLGRMEDPDYTVRELVVTTSWPGASAKQVEEQVTDRLEKKLQNIDGLLALESYSLPGQSIIYVELKDQVEKKDIALRWTDARNFVKEAQSSLPAGTVESVVNDHFDDVYGMVYALTADEGYSYEDMRQKAEKIRQRILKIPQTKKVELIGVQTQSIYINAKIDKMAQLGVSVADITGTIQGDNKIVAQGMLSTPQDNLYLRPRNVLPDIAALRMLPMEKNGQIFHLSDVAEVERGYLLPEEPKFYYQGKPAIGIAASMTVGENIMDFGEALQKTMQEIEGHLPAGMEIHQTVNQASVVHAAIYDFVKSLVEALLIIFAVSLLALGRRAGLVVACCIPLVMAAVFSVMYFVHIDLQRVSLGALILSLGLLVDDAMIVIEMMLVKLEEGTERRLAAVHAYKVTALPMLTGTIITCAGFIPVGFAKGSASEYCSSIFSVVTIALLASWLAASTVTPILGYHFIGVDKPRKKGRFSQIKKEFYAWYHKMLLWTIEHKKIVLISTLLAFFCSIAGLQLLRQEYFPASTRLDLIVQLEPPAGSSAKNTELISARFAEELAAYPELDYYTYHTGEGAPRFVLTFEPANGKPNFAEFVLVAKDLDGRKQLEQDIAKLLQEKFPEIKSHMKVILTGDSFDYPTMLRVEGEDMHKVREIADQVAEKMKEDPAVRNVNLKTGSQLWGIHLNTDTARNRQLGVTEQSLSVDLQRAMEGEQISAYQEGDQLLPIVFRIQGNSTLPTNDLMKIPVHLASGKNVPLEQVASVSMEKEDDEIYRKDGRPSIQVCAEVKGGKTGEDVATDVYEGLAGLRQSLPPGYAIRYDGVSDDSDITTGLLLEPVPAMALIILIVLMFQLQNVVKACMTLFTAPLGMIGVTAGLLLTGRPMGFVVMLGVLALFGIIIRNSVILIDQIGQHEAAGERVREAVVHAAESRLRPIMLTAMAAILAMIPLARNVFWGPMAVAIGSGLFVATVLTLFILPVMYTAWYERE